MFNVSLFYYGNLRQISNSSSASVKINFCNGFEMVNSNCLLMFVVSYPGFLLNFDIKSIMARHSFLSFIVLSNFFISPFLSSSYTSFLDSLALFLLLSISDGSVKFSKPLFLIMYPRSFNCSFLMLRMWPFLFEFPFIHISCSRSIVLILVVITKTKVGTIVHG